MKQENETGKWKNLYWENDWLIYMILKDYNSAIWCENAIKELHHNIIYFFLI